MLSFAGNKMLTKNQCRSGATHMMRWAILTSLIATVVITGPSRAAGSAPPIPVIQLSLSEPEGLRFDAHNHLYLADTGHNRILELTTAGRIIRTWGKKGSGPGQFDAPESATVDAVGNLYVADFNNRRLQKLSPTGTPLAQWKAGDPQFGCECRDAVFDARGHLYVADEATIYLYRLTTRLKVTGKWDTGSSSVRAVATDYKNDVWIATDGDEVEELSPTGKVLAHWGKHGQKPGQLDEPMAVTLEAGGNIYVADSQNNRVQELSPHGKVMAIFGQGTSALAQSSNPEGVAVDGRGTVYVADTYDNRIQVYSAGGSLLAVWGRTS
jgi:DNA-binding beta-propeller fold protein YncE